MLRKKNNKIQFNVIQLNLKIKFNRVQFLCEKDFGY